MNKNQKIEKIVEEFRNIWGAKILKDGKIIYAVHPEIVDDQIEWLRTTMSTVMEEDLTPPNQDKA
jgi:Txe/YoeB family toxin of Txe-Axe toxin-antitoxin module